MIFFKVSAHNLTPFCKVFSGEDRGPIQRRFKVVRSDELPPLDANGEVQADAGGEEDGNLPQELLQEVRNILES